MLNKKYYEVPQMELLSVELHSCFAASEYVNTPSGGGLKDLVNVDVESWD